MVDFPHVVAKAVFVACEMILTHEWDKVFPGQDMYFSPSDFLGNPTDDIIAKKVLWDVCNMEQYGAPDLYDMKFVSVTLGNGASIQMVWRKTSKIYKEIGKVAKAEWELAKIQLMSPPNYQANPMSNEVVSIDFPKKLSATKRPPSFEQLKEISRDVIKILRGLS